MKHSIALKIFGLAVGILLMMITVSIINSIAVIKLGKEVNEISVVSLPIANHSAELNEVGLRRRIAFERLYREYSFAEADSSVLKDAEPNFEKFSKAVVDQIALLKKDLSILPDDTKEREIFAQARELVSSIESTFDQQNDIARRILKKKKAKEEENYKVLMEINVQGQTLLQEKRSSLQNLAMQLAQLSAIKAKKAEQNVLWSSLILSLLAITLGLWGAWILSRKLARPLMSLIQSTRAVHGGNLSVNINGLPEDEIGQLGDSLNQMIEELRKKQDLQNLINTYIDPRIVEKIIIPGRQDMFDGQKQIMTVFFSDIVGFAKISEQLSPTSLVKIVNRYLTIMTECIQAEEGIIDKYIGDAIMAYWGPPFVKEEDQAAAACRAALGQIKALDQFRKELPDLMGLRKNIPEINIRIGIATGEVVVGNIGSNTARSYTVMGDIVNLASRLESANKEYGTHILISEDTMLMSGNTLESNEIDQIILKGKSEPVKVYELLALEGALTPENELRRTRFNAGLTAYRKQDWVAANLIFKELIEKFNCAPSATYFERIKILETHDLGSGWDGVWRMLSK